MPSLETLVELLKPWAKFYAKSSTAQAVVVFTHVGALLGGGGLAIAADRAMLKARTATDEVRAKLLADVEATHTPVIVGLVLMFVSGVAMTLADIETFLKSPIWWGKMAFIVLLLINGAWLRSIERGMQRSPTTIAPLWKKLGLSSRFSYLLWFAVVLGGVLLKNA